MGTRTAPPSIGAPRPRSRYAEVWGAALLLTCAGLVVSAVLQSPLGPLLALVVTMAVWGALVGAVDPQRASRRGETPTPLRMSGGALVGACGVLILVGVGHDPAAGMASLGLLAGVSPWTLRWIAGR
jgi:hypothetical protein